ncbi:MAG: hypothetical protein WA635_09980 [Gallionella sp.]
MKLRKPCSKIFILTSIIFFLFSIICYISYKSDILYLRSIVRSNISTENSPRVFESINHWVYQNKGFKKNPAYFIFKSLGPTPIQVLNQGGDCTDKSILLMAMLESIGKDSTLVMLYDADGKTPTHTVVEVSDGQFKAVADPVYDLVFPNSNGGFYSIEDLRKNPALLLNRLDNLLQIRGTSSKIIYYRRINESYQFASPINWNKNNLLRITSNILGGMGIEARDIRRPHFLDDPKLFISMALFITSLFFIILALVFKEKQHPIKPECSTPL